MTRIRFVNLDVSHLHISLRRVECTTFLLGKQRVAAAEATRSSDLRGTKEWGTMHAIPPCGCANDRRDAGPMHGPGDGGSEIKKRVPMRTRKTGTRVALYFLSCAAAGSFPHAGVGEVKNVRGLAARQFGSNRCVRNEKRGFRLFFSKTRWTAARVLRHKIWSGKRDS